MAEATEQRVGRRGDVHARLGDGRGPGRGRLVAGLIVVLALAVVAAVVLVRGGGEPAADDTELQEAIAEVDAAPVTEAQGAWRPLPPLPLPARSEQAAVWTGRELLVWGGALDDGFGRRTFHGDGAALDPATGAWRPLPPAPLEPRTDHAAVWTGGELVIWGGTGRTGQLADGAAYDPARDRWRALPAAPLSPRAGAAVVWTGQALLVLGGADNAGPLVDGAALDAESGDWRPIAPLPADFTTAGPLDAIASGAGAVAWTGDRGGLGVTLLARYDAAADAWSPLPDPVSDAAGLPVLVDAGGRLTGLRVAGDGTSAELVALDGEAWQATSAPPLLGDPWATTALWTGSTLLLAAGDGRGALVYDPATGSWTTVPDPPPAGTADRSAVWTGAELLLSAGLPGPADDPDATGTAAWRPR